MPIIKSAKKRARQSKVRRSRNIVTKDAIKSARKLLATARATSNQLKLDEALRAYQSALDMAVKKKVIHKNKAARLKSTAMQGMKPAKPAAKKTTPAKKPVIKKNASAKTTKKPAAKKTTPAKKPVIKKNAVKKPAKK